MAFSTLRARAPSVPSDSDDAAAPAVGGAPVHFIQVNKSFGTKNAEVAALRDISLDIPAGGIFGIIGRSGAGKSTLVRTINRLERITTGQVMVDGVDVNQLDEDGLVLLRRRIGMIFQHFNLLSAKTVWENVALPLVVAGVRPALIERKVSSLLEIVGLSDKRAVYPAKLSGGQKQRVGIARALVHDPQILLCDEATSALDPETTQSILALLRDINRRLGLTVVLITHEMSVIREVCDSVAVLERGELVEQGEVWQVFGKPQHAATQALLSQLVHDLPADLAARLQAEPVPGPGARMVLSLRFTGDQPEAPALDAIVRAFDGPVQLLHGGIDRIQGRALGRLLLSVRLPDGDVANVLHQAQSLGATVEVLGYVAASI